MPLRRRRATPRRRNAPQWTFEEWDAADRVLLLRCGHRCEKCGHLIHGSMERHHRQRRAVGGDRLANLLALHPHCHRWITEHPRESMAQGWIVSSYASDPASVSVLIAGRWWLLDDDGGKHPT